MRTLHLAPRARRAGPVAVALLGLAVTATATAQQDQPVVARCTSEKSLLLRRAAADRPWQVVRERDELRAGELLVGGPGAAMRAGDVRLSFLGELTGTSAYPVRETAVVLHDSKDVDLDFTLDRGHVDLVNRKAKGPARVRVRIRDRSAEVVLSGPGARLAIETFGRWLPGAPFRRDAKPREGPALAVVAVALRGEVEVRGKEKHFLLKGPPGPALLHAGNLDVADAAPQHLDRVPEWADGRETEREKKFAAIAARFRGVAVEKSVEAAVDALLKSDDADERAVAVTLMGATDDLRRLAEVMATAAHPDVWDTGVLTLRHWIGRGPGQDQKLYKGLVEKGGLPPVQAETVLQLLHGLPEEALALPVTYQALIRLLESERLAIRGLAYWHLTRLVPDGRDLGYDPLGPKEKREEAIKRWQKHIPPGKVPPKPAARDKGA